MSINFAAFAASLLPDAERLVASWLPNGKRRGHEWMVGSLNGEAGDSLSINLRTGKWADFAGKDKGGDLLSLYAAVRGLSQLEAARELGAEDDRPQPAPERKPAVIEPPGERPPPDTTFHGKHYRWGDPVSTYCYADRDGPIFYVCRYEPEGERKQFSPWRWLNGKWEAKAFSKPRPLYGLDRLQAAKPTKRVMLVEGEKAADALRPILKTHVVMTWAGGAKAFDTADFTPLADRNVDLWPDQDLPGREAMATIGARLNLGAGEIRIVNPEGKPEGWHAADAMAEGWNLEQLAAWIQREGGRYLVTLPKSPQSAPEERARPPVPPSPASTPARAAATPGTDARGERSMWMAMGLETNVGNGTPPPNEDTVLRAIQHSLRDRFWYDTFLQRAMTDWEEPTPRPVHDADYAKLTVWMQRDLRLFKMTRPKVTSGLELHLFTNQRNSAQEWMRGLVWDRQARLDFMLERGFGCDPSEYHQAVSRNFMMGMVARVLRPGCQVDSMPVFEGGQGRGKSSALRILGGAWFTEATDSILTKDFLQNLHGKMLVEIAELHAFKKAEQDRIKGIITNRVDTYRASYGRTAGDYPRQCVFAGTTNRDDWVMDDTGARRFWRVLTGSIDLVWLSQHREQLFAEAVYRLEASEPYWHVPEQEARRIVEGARNGDPWTDAVLRYASRYSEVRPEDILTHGLEKKLADQSKADMAAIRSILRVAGWVSVNSWVDGTCKKVWRKPRTAPPEKPERGQEKAADPYEPGANANESVSEFTEDELL